MVDKIISDEFVVPHESTQRPWKEWIRAIDDYFTNRLRQRLSHSANAEKTPTFVFTGKAPISLFVYLGVKSRSLPRVTIVNETFETKQWESWNLSSESLPSSERIFNRVTISANEEIGKVVIF